MSETPGRREFLSSTVACLATVPAVAAGTPTAAAAETNGADLRNHSYQLAPSEG